jgi:hypothetical protein
MREFSKTAERIDFLKNIHKNIQKCHNIINIQNFCYLPMAAAASARRYGGCISYGAFPTHFS